MIFINKGPAAGKGVSSIKKSFLLKKLQKGCHLLELETEIGQSVDLGGSVSVSPAYTFFYSEETGLQYIRNRCLERVYGDLKTGRQPVSYLIFETKEKKQVKIRGAVNYLRLRMVYDSYCPQVLLGEKGREMDLDRLKALYLVRKHTLRNCSIVLAVWSVVMAACPFMPPEISVIAFTFFNLCTLIYFIRSLRRLMKT